MARTDTLNNFLTDVADSIRTKKGTTNKIPASNFDTEIEGIETGSVPNLQSKSIAITENGTQNVTADEGYDGLSNVSLNIEVSDIGEPNYITDGLIALFDISSPIINNKWNNIVGDDYITAVYVGGGSDYFDYFLKNPIGLNNTYFISSKDYYKQGYTIEVVGRLGGINSTNTSGGWLLTGNISGSSGIGIRSRSSSNTPAIEFINNPTNQKLDDFRTNYNKLFGASIYFDYLLPRNNSTSYRSIVSGSLNGSDWVTITESNSRAKTSKSENTIFLSYYSDNYRAVGEIKCIRVYNRKLTNDELKVNHNIDVKRFNLN